MSETSEQAPTPAIQDPIEVAAARIGAALEGVEIGISGALVLTSVAFATFIVNGLSLEAVSEFCKNTWQVAEAQIAATQAFLALPSATPSVH